MKKLLFILLVVLAAWLFWRWWRSSAEVADHGQDLVFDRLWVDHLPDRDTDPIQVFVAVTEQPFGIFQRASTWRGEYELFRYEPQGDGRLVLLYPQTRQKELATYRATRCREKSFDFCLALDGNSRGARRYYSEKGWEIGAVKSPSALETRIESLLEASR